MAASLISDNDQIKSVLSSKVNNNSNIHNNVEYFIWFFPHRPSGEEARNDMQYAKKG